MLQRFAMEDELFFRVVKKNCENGPFCHDFHYIHAISWALVPLRFARLLWPSRYVYTVKMKERKVYF